MGDFDVHKVDHERYYDLHELEALDHVVLVALDEAEIAHYEHDALQVVDQLQLAHLLVQHGDELLALLSELVQRILFFEHSRLGLASAGALNRD